MDKRKKETYQKAKERWNQVACSGQKQIASRTASKQKSISTTTKIFKSYRYRGKQNRKEKNIKLEAEKQSSR